MLYEVITKSWKVIATGRNEEKLNNLKSAGAEIIKTDITNPQDINNLVTHIVVITSYSIHYTKLSDFRKLQL